MQPGVWNSQRIFMCLLRRTVDAVIESLYFDVLNRGRKNTLRDFNGAPQVAEPATEADFGDGFLMRRGFTLVWVGWQFDVPKARGLMGMDASVATEKGRPITGRVMTSFTPNTASVTFALEDNFYKVDSASAANTLIERGGFMGTPSTIPRDQWQFGRMADGHVVPAKDALYLKTGFQAGHVYELSYEAQGSVVAGLGFAALRDVAAAIKHQSGPLAPVRYAYVFGPSQDGRLLREFLYEGFNADEQDRRVFDGVIANIAGAARGDDFNARFARPNGLGFFTATLFPYLDLEQRDSVSGKSAGLLTRLRPEIIPKIFYTNSSTEYWGRGPRRRADPYDA
jgi:hypothetical protein